MLNSFRVANVAYTNTHHESQPAQVQPRVGKPKESYLNQFLKYFLWNLNQDKIVS